MTPCPLPLMLRLRMARAGGNVPTSTVAPAEESCRAMAQPYPVLSATPATNATCPEQKGAAVRVRTGKADHGGSLENNGSTRRN